VTGFAGPKNEESTVKNEENTVKNEENTVEKRGKYSQALFGSEKRGKHSQAVFVTCPDAADINASNF